MSEQTDWNFNFDLRDVTSPTTKPPVAPEGYYTGKITKTFIDVDYNKDRVVFLVRIAEGKSTGAFCRDTMMLPGTTQRDNRRYWRGLFESMGFEARQINAQTLQISNASSIFVGKTVTFYWKPGDKELGTWNRLLYMNKVDWTAEKGAFDAAKAVVAAVPAAAPTPKAAAPKAVPSTSAQTEVAPTPQAGFISNNMSSDDILAMLNNPSNNPSN
jgi:hypothetical protein